MSYSKWHTEYVRASNINDNSCKYTTPTPTTKTSCLTNAQIRSNCNNRLRQVQRRLTDLSPVVVGGTANTGTHSPVSSNATSLATNQRSNAQARPKAKGKSKTKTLSLSTRRCDYPEPRIIRQILSISIVALVVLLLVLSVAFLSPVVLTKSIDAKQANSVLEETRPDVAEQKPSPDLKPTQQPDQIAIQSQTITTQRPASSFSHLLSKLTSVFTATTPIETSTQSLLTEPTTEEPETTNEDDTSSGDANGDAKDCQGISSDPTAEGKNLTDHERLVNLQSCLQSKVKRRILSATRSGLELFDKLSLSGGCSASLMNLMASLGDIKSFAFKFLDASAKIPSGMMYGLLSDFGDFDQCMSIRSNPSVPVELEAEELNAYSGKYCLMSIKLNYHIELDANKTTPEGIIPDGVIWDELVRNYWTSKVSKGFQVGMCFPSKCTDDDLDQIFRQVTSGYNINGEVMSCQDGTNLKAQYTPDSLQLIILYSFATLLILTLIGTILDRYCNRKANKCEFLDALSKVLICFSVIRNWRKFMRSEKLAASQLDYLTNSLGSSNETKSDDGEEDLRALHQCSSFASTPSDETNRSMLTSNNMSFLSSCSSSENFIQNKRISDSLHRPLSVQIGPEVEHIFTCTNYGKPLEHLAGLRLIIILWITIGHSFLYPSAHNYQYYRSIIRMNITRDSVWFAATNFTLGIDMLLYITGLVFVYKLTISAPKMHSKPRERMSSQLDLKAHGIMQLLSRRILRFWPTYLSVIALAIVVPMLSDGPMWPEMVTKRLGTACRTNWWANLLLINNFMDQDEICLPSSWFISTIMQLFLIGSIVMLLSRRYSPKVAIFAISLLLLASIVANFALAYKTNIRAPAIKMDESFVLELDATIFRMYTNILNNLGPFLIGMIGGFVLVNSKLSTIESCNLSSAGSRRRAAFISRNNSCLSSGKDNLSKGKRSEDKNRFNLNVLVQIMVAMIVAVVAILVLSSVFHQNYTRFWSAVYWSMHRIGWAIVTGYVVHQCATGKWKLINDFLSLSTFVPLSKLIFIAYLVYPIFIHIHSGLVRDGLHVSIYNMLNIYTTRLVMTFATALAIHLLVELPFCSIEEIFLKKLFLPKDDKTTNKETDKNDTKTLPLLLVAPTIQVDFDPKPTVASSDKQPESS